MDETTLKMAMAGFFHDIGKFADRDTLGATDRYFNDNADLYLPFRDGRHTHHHALYTAAFIEQMKAYLPPELNSRQWGGGDAFINLAAGHHKPETPMQQIVTVADWLTSEMDRDLFESENGGIAVQDYKKTRLLPLFEQLKNSGLSSLEDFEFAYPLKPLSPESIFPSKRKVGTAKGGEKAEYQELFNRFFAELKSLWHKDENPGLWFEHFESLFMVFTSSIPAARVGNVVPDVSLYDHCRLTSAFASALYLYHQQTESLAKPAIMDKQDKKFLLISGNFFGIQDFIFSEHGDSRKFRSKILRGRSFYVTLLSEMAADMLVRAIGLPSISTILNAAGRFTLLAPNTKATIEALERIKKRVNDWLLRVAFGEVSMGFSSVPACYEDFTPEKFRRLWDDLGKAGEIPKFQKIDIEEYGGVVAGYTDRFINDLPHPMCPLCGKRPSEKGTNEAFAVRHADPVCRICRDHVHIGSRLVKDDRIFILSKDAVSNRQSEFLYEPLFAEYQLQFLPTGKEASFGGTQIVKCWDISMSAQDLSTGGVTKKLINGYVPKYRGEDLQDDRILQTEKTEAKKAAMIDEMKIGEIKSLNHIAAAALNRANGTGKISGIDALGVLKADVDNLGLLMACGIDQNRFTLSRLATLSRQFNYYFALYIPHLLGSSRSFNDVYTVFSGGDDLFLVGPWNRIYELALELSESFADYVCRNPEIHFSAGITLQKSSTPLGHLASMAEKALEQSKAGGRNRLNMFFETARWEDMKALEEIREKLEAWLDEAVLTKSMLYRLNRFIETAESERRVLAKKEIKSEDMESLKWRAMFSYAAVRNIAKNEKDESLRNQVVRKILAEMVVWLDRHRGNLRVPLWNILYNHR